mgnify:CR=1 FL=1
MISRCLLYLDTTFSRAVSNTTCSKSCNVTCDNSLHFFPLNFNFPDIVHFFGVTTSWWCHHWSWGERVTQLDWSGTLTFDHLIKLVAESRNWALRLLMKAWVFLSSGFSIKHFSLKHISLTVSISKMKHFEEGLGMMSGWRDLAAEVADFRIILRSLKVNWIKTHAHCLCQNVKTCWSSSLYFSHLKGRLHSLSRLRNSSLLRFLFSMSPVRCISSSRMMGSDILSQ